MSLAIEEAEDDGRSSWEWVLPPLRKGHGADAALVERRSGARTTGVDEVSGITVGDELIGGVNCRVLEPEVWSATILYFHGGGYRLGSLSGWTQHGARLAAETSCRVVMVDYRLAPEHPFPAAIHDAANSYKSLVIEGSNVVVGGDSAGGGLAAALIVACNIAGAPVPKGMFLLSPWLNLLQTAESYLSRAHSDFRFSAQAAHDAAELYLQGAPAEDPLASPLYGRLDKFPTTLLFAGGDEVLLDDTLAFTSRLAKAGVSVETHIVSAMQHVWPVLDPDLASSGITLRVIARFLEILSDEEGHRSLSASSNTESGHSSASDSRG
jgi:monoterpene epsilon-lactone hydrolase